MALFFTNIRETYHAFTSDTPNSVDSKTFGARGTTGASVRSASPADAWGRIGITVLLIGVAVFLLIGDSKSQLASGIIGAVMGYWLK